MASPFLLSLVAALLAGLAVLVPHVLESLRLIHFTTDFSPYAPRVAQLQQSCKPQHPSKLIGCEDIHLVGNSIYTACLTSFKNSDRWSRAPDTNASSIPGDGIYRWDLDTDTPVLLKLVNTPGDASAASRSYNGIDVNQLKNGSVSIYVTNMLPSGGAIDKFVHDPKTSVATHVLRVETNDSPHAAPNPNDIFSLPELDDDAAMWVTNDRYSTPHTLMWDIEYYTRRPWTWVSYYSKSTGWKTALSGVVTANGITGNKDPKGRKIYVSEVMNGVLKVLKPSEKEQGVLEPVQDVKLGLMVDNPALVGEDLYLAGIVRAHKFGQYAKQREGGSPVKPDQIGKGGLGMGVKRLSTKQLGEGFYGGGYTADPVLETLIFDGLGLLGNLSSTSVFKPYANKAAGGDENDDAETDSIPSAKVKGDLFVTGPKFKGVLKCTNFDA